MKFWKKSCEAVSTAFKLKKSARAELFQITNYPAINRRLPVPWILKFYPYYYKKRCLNKPNRKVISDKSCQYKVYFKKTNLVSGY